MCASAVAHCVPQGACQLLLVNVTRNAQVLHIGAPVVVAVAFACHLWGCEANCGHKLLTIQVFVLVNELFPLCTPVCCCCVIIAQLEAAVNNYLAIDSGIDQRQFRGGLIWKPRNSLATGRPFPSAEHYLPLRQCTYWMLKCQRCCCCLHGTLPLTTA
jgi:hypothetical protein